MRLGACPERAKSTFPDGIGTDAADRSAGREQPPRRARRLLPQRLVEVKYFWRIVKYRNIRTNIQRNCKPGIQVDLKCDSVIRVRWRSVRCDVIDAERRAKGSGYSWVGPVAGRLAVRIVCARGHEYDGVCVDPVLVEVQNDPQVLVRPRQWAR